MKQVITVVSFALVCGGMILQPAGADSTTSQNVLQIPTAVKHEHHEIHASLVRIIGAKGSTGPAARQLAAVLHRHFVKEEQMALPPLALLPQLARGAAPSAAQRQAALALTTALQKAMPQMLREHQSIKSALARLESAARREKHTEALRFVAALKAHAGTEEQVLYPASLLVGRVLRR